MTSITLHDLDDGVADALRARAAKHGRSVEQEACAILGEVVGAEDGDEVEPPPELPPGGLATAFREHFRDYWEEFGGDVELPIPPREPAREPPTFD